VNQGRARLFSIALVLSLASCTAPKVEPAVDAKPTEVAAPVVTPPVVTPPVVPPPVAEVKQVEVTPPVVTNTRYQQRPATIASSGRFVCALEGAGQVACWGRGASGQLGPGSPTLSAVPVRVAGIDDAVALAATSKLGCALRAGGAVTCWGAINAGAQQSTVSAGALGDVVEMVLVDGPTTSVCARRSDGKIACTQLRGPVHTTAELIGGIDDAVALQAHNRNLYVLRASGVLSKYAAFERGGPGLTAAETIPDVQDIGRNDMKMCVTMNSGERRCRYFDQEWKLEKATDGPLWQMSMRRELVAGAIDAVDETLVECIRDAEGRVACWGLNDDGQLGLGKPAFASEPRKVLEGPSVALAAGGDRSCAVSVDGKIACFDHEVVDEVEAGVEGVRALAVGGYHWCAIVGGGEARCWGSNEAGQLGVGGEPEELVRVPGLSDLAFIAVSGDHSCAVRRDHSVRCWGLGDVGQLGNGRYDDPNKEVDEPYASAAQVLVAGLSGEVRGLALADSSSCVVTATGLSCWGRAPNPSTLDDARFTRPRQVLDGAVKAVDGERESMCALDGAGEVHCWGPAAENYRGGAWVKMDLDDMDEDPNRFVEGGPLWRLGELGFVATALAVGSEHACVLSEADEMWCWGDNDEGQLGDGTAEKREEPVKVVGLPGTPVQIAAGFDHSCARLADGASYCWGSKTGPRELGRSDTPRRIEGLTPYVVAAKP
jgi:alpha-tubulin suppressor-like RCC1 family protein